MDAKQLTNKIQKNPNAKIDPTENITQENFDLNKGSDTNFIFLLEPKLRRLDSNLYDKLTSRDAPALLYNFVKALTKNEAIGIPRDLNYSLKNIPRLSKTRLNWDISKEQIQKMLSTPKAIVGFITHEKDNTNYYKENSKFIVSRLLMIPLDRKDENIYRLDILQNPDDPSFYGMEFFTIVNGYADGEVSLLKMVCSTKKGNAELYLANTKNNRGSKFDTIDDYGTYGKLDKNLNIHSVNDVVNYIFEYCGILYKQIGFLSDGNITKMQGIFEKEAKHIEEGSSLIAKTTGEEFTSMFAIMHNSQLINKDGVVEKQERPTIMQTNNADITIAPPASRNPTRDN